jgi:hypothetical protein
MIIRKLNIINRNIINERLFQKRIETNKNINPVANSTKGYCQDIFFWQYLHLPFNTRKLNKGIRSKKFNWCLHLGQIDLPLRKLFLIDTLQIMQFKNDPTINPKRKIAILKNIIMFNIMISTNSPHCYMRRVLLFM